MGAPVSELDGDGVVGHPREDPRGDGHRAAVEGEVHELCLWHLGFGVGVVFVLAGVRWEYAESFGGLWAHEERVVPDDGGPELGEFLEPTVVCGLPDVVAVGVEEYIKVVLRGCVFDATLAHCFDGGFGIECNLGRGDGLVGDDAVVERGLPDLADLG